MTLTRTRALALALDRARALAPTLNGTPTPTPTLPLPLSPILSPTSTLNLTLTLIQTLSLDALLRCGDEDGFGGAGEEAREEGGHPSEHGLVIGRAHRTVRPLHAGQR